MKEHLNSLYYIVCFILCSIFFSSCESGGKEPSKEQGEEQGEAIVLLSKQFDSLFNYKLTPLPSFKDGEEVTFSKGDVYCYDFSSISSRIELYDLVLTLFVSRDYVYDRFNFELRVLSPDFHELRDTISLPLRSDRVARERFTNVILENLKLNSGTYSFQIASLMGSDFDGLENIKLRMIPN